MAVDLNSVNYILLKADGSVLTQKMDYYIQQGNIGDVIFFGGLAAQNTDVGIAVCTLPNGEQNTIAGVWDTCTYKIDGVDTTIGGFKFTLGSAQTEYAGGLMMALTIFRSSTRLVSYPLYAVINETGLMSDTDTGVTVEEINTYLQQIQAMLRVDNSILVVDSIGDITDWSEYQTGQLFLAKDTGLLYIKHQATSPFYQEYSGFDYVKKTHTSDRIYGTDELGNQRVFEVDSDIVSGNDGIVVRRELPGGQVVVGNPTEVYHATTKKYVADYYVPYSGATQDLNLGNHTLTVNEIDIGSSYYQIGIVSGNLVIGTGTGDIDLQPQGKLLYNSSEICTKENVVKNQVETVFIVDPLTNINGRAFQTYSSTNVTIGGHTAVKILKGGNKCSEQDAKEYMEYMTGSYYLPVFNYDKPKNTYLIDPDGHVYKPQYDSTNGLLLYDFGDIATKGYVSGNYVAKVGSGSYDRVYGVASNGTQTTYNISQNATSNSIVQRTSGGKINAGIAGSTFSNTDAVNKYYVDQAIAAAVSTLYEYKGTKTVAQLNALTGQTVGDVYNVSDSGTLTAGNVQVLAGDNVVWDGSAWDKLAGTVDLSGYYNKTQVDNLLSAKADITAAIMDADITLVAGYVSQIDIGGTNYPVAQNVAVTTIPKVVQFTSQLPATNDGYLYLVLNDGYLYAWDITQGAYMQAYQYTSDLLTITEVTVEED